jgi:hypothetical protein
MDAISFARAKTAARRERVHAAARRLHRPEGAAQLGRALCSGGQRVEHEALTVRRPGRGEGVESVEPRDAAVGAAVRPGRMDLRRKRAVAVRGVGDPLTIRRPARVGSEDPHPRLAATVATDTHDAREVHLFAGENSNASIFGVAAQDVAAIEIDLRDGRVLKPELYDAPRKLGAKLKFFIVRLPLSPPMPGSGSPVRFYKAYDRDGTMIERLRD